MEAELLLLCALSVCQRLRLRRFCNCALCVQDCSGGRFVVQGDMVQCGITESETCLKSVTLGLSGGANVSVTHMHTHTHALEYFMCKDKNISLSYFVYLLTGDQHPVQWKGFCEWHLRSVTLLCW